MDLNIRCARFGSLIIQITIFIKFRIILNNRGIVVNKD